VGCDASKETVSEIEARIPHRAPFLFVDRVLERGEGSIRTEWVVPPDADFFRGHYPGDPILPGVIASEFVFQSGALLVGDPDAPWASAGAIPVLARVQDARFRSLVRPGARLEASVQLDEQVGSAFLMRGEVEDESGTSVLKVRFTVSMKARES
jgi:3-hydroxyacyl-[acyl-carrier-protein] dehydratase